MSKNASKVFSFLPHYYDEKRGEILYCYGNDDPASSRQMWQSVIAGIVMAAVIVLVAFVVSP